MLIDKLTSFRGVEKEPLLPSKSQIKKSSGNELTQEQEEKSNAAKYMIGAVELAGVNAIGIAGHKNNWWRKAKNAGEELSNGGPKPHFNGGKKPQRPPEIVRSIDGSVLQLEFAPNGNFLKVTKIQPDGITPRCVTDFDPKTGNPKQRIEYQPDGTTPICFTEYSQGRALANNPKQTTLFPESYFKPIKDTYYYDDGITPKSIIDYNPKTGNWLKRTEYQEDGKTPKVVIDYDPETNARRLKKTEYRDGSDKVERIVDYTNETRTYYKDDGMTIDRIEPFA